MIVNLIVKNNYKFVNKQLFVCILVLSLAMVHRGFSAKVGQLWALLCYFICRCAPCSQLQKAKHIHRLLRRSSADYRNFKRETERARGCTRAVYSMCMFLHRSAEKCSSQRQGHFKKVEIELKPDNSNISSNMSFVEFEN